MVLGLDTIFSGRGTQWTPDFRRTRVAHALALRLSSGARDWPLRARQYKKFNMCHLAASGGPYRSRFEARGRPDSAKNRVFRAFEAFFGTAGLAAQDFGRWDICGTCGHSIFGHLGHAPPPAFGWDGRKFILSGTCSVKLPGMKSRVLVAA